MCDTYARLRRLAEIHAQIEIESVQGQLDLQQPWVYVPREEPPAPDNEELPAFLKIQAE